MVHEQLQQQSINKSIEDSTDDDEASDLANNSSRPGWRRYVVAWMSCLGLMIVLAMRSEIGIAIIQMTRKEREKVAFFDPKRNDTEYKTEFVQEVAWTRVDIGLVEASFFVGYASFSVPGGLLASRLSAPGRLLGAAVLATCSLNLLVPAAARLEPSSLAFFAASSVRAAQGAAEGSLYPCVHALWRYWAPAMERSRLVTISFFGMALGPIVGLPLSGALTDHLGWPANFYVYGVAGGLWAIAWLCLVPGQPSWDRSIGAAELHYILANSVQTEGGRGATPAIVRLPIRSIFTSMPVWAIVLANIGRNWTFQFSTIGLPAYYAKVFKLDSEAVGLHLMAPFVLMAALTPVGGILADTLRSRLMSTTSTRKLLNTLGFGIMALCMAAIGLSRNPYLSTALLTLGFGFTGLGMSGYGVNHLDIAPRFAGFLMGLSNGIGTVSGVVSPILASRVARRGTVEEWRTVFLVAAAVHAVTVACYYCMASGDLQPWSDASETVRLIEPSVNSAATTAGDDSVPATVKPYRDKEDADETDAAKSEPADVRAEEWHERSRILGDMKN